MTVEDIHLFMINVKTMRKLQEDYRKTGCKTCKRSMDIMESKVDYTTEKYFNENKGIELVKKG